VQLLFKFWYARLGFKGASSHSGRRTFITRFSDPRDAAAEIDRMKAEGEDIADLTAEKIVDAAQNTDRYCIEFAEGEFLQEPDTRIRFYKNALYFFPIRGSLAYLAAWDVRPAKVFGRCDETTGIVPFNRLVEDVMAQEPHRSAPRVFWIMDNGTSLRGERGDKRIQGKWKNIVPVCHSAPLVQEVAQGAPETVEVDPLRLQANQSHSASAPCAVPIEK